MQNHVLCYGRSTNCYVDAIQRSCDVHVTLNEVLWRVSHTRLGFKIISVRNELLEHFLTI